MPDTDHPTFLGIAPQGGLLHWHSGKVRDTYLVVEPNQFDKLGWACFLAFVDTYGWSWG